MTNDGGASQSEFDPAVGPTSPPRRRWFQFSLATLLCITTFAACLASLWIMYRDLRASRDEVRKYRNELEYPAISDLRKIYARGVTTIEDDKRFWRIYLPSKPKFGLYASTEHIPVEGFPVSQESIPLEPGEHLLETSLYAPYADESERREIYCQIQIDGGTVATIKMRPGGATEAKRISTQKAADPGTPLILLRLRNMTTANDAHFTTNPNPQPCDGLMIWIEEAK